MKENIYGKVEADGRRYRIFYYTDNNVKKILDREGFGLKHFGGFWTPSVIYKTKTEENYGEFVDPNIRVLLTELGYEIVE